MTKLSLEDVFSVEHSFSYPELVSDQDFGIDGLLFLGSSGRLDTDVKQDKKNSRKRLVIYFQDKHSKATQCLTPEGYDLSTRFSEYGGRPYWVVGRSIYFSNATDHHLYKQSIIAIDDGVLSLSQPERISPDDGHVVHYTNVIEYNESCIFCLAEHVEPPQGNQTVICAIDYSAKPKATVLAQGSDFYSNFVINKQKDKLAWVQWQHPNMPWDDTQLCIADVNYDQGELAVTEQQTIAYEKAVSFCQLAFADNNRLFFSIDYSDADEDWQNYWNIHYIDVNQADLTAYAVTKIKQEFGYPHWQYGNQRIVRFNQHTLLAFSTDVENDCLYRIDVDTLDVTLISDNLGTLQSLSSNSDDSNAQATFITLAADKPAQILTIDDQYQIDTVLSESAAKQLAPEQISLAQHIKFATRDGEHAYGFFYPPVNDASGAKATDLPPLIVMVHGGPTSRCYGFYDKQKQFWLQRGFAILDVNHRGSCGYGRQFRDALYGKWGEIDATDIVDGINHLINEKKIDGDKVVIRGKSAGGYAVLCALTQSPEVFKAGACYYGIGNLVTLTELTHKFEKHYTDQLLDEVFDLNRAQQPDSAFYQRSPIHQMHELKSAMIIFQGSVDKVVPPEVAHEVTAVLKENNIPYEYYEYYGEGHGFKKSENNVDAWTKELDFYRRVLEL